MEIVIENKNSCISNLFICGGGLLKYEKRYLLQQNSKYLKILNQPWYGNSHGVHGKQKFTYFKSFLNDFNNISNISKIFNQLKWK